MWNESCSGAGFTAASEIVCSEWIHCFSETFLKAIKANMFSKMPLSITSVLRNCVRIALVELPTVSCRLFEVISHQKLYMCWVSQRLDSWRLNHVIDHHFLLFIISFESIWFLLECTGTACTSKCANDASKSARVAQCHYIFMSLFRFIYCNKRIEDKNAAPALLSSFLSPSVWNPFSVVSCGALPSPFPDSRQVLLIGDASLSQQSVILFALWFLFLFSAIKIAGINVS